MYNEKNMINERLKNKYFFFIFLIKIETTLYFNSLKNDT